MIFLICENNLKINDDIANEFTKYMVKYPYLYKDLAYTISNEIKNNAINLIQCSNAPAKLVPCHS